MDLRPFSCYSGYMIKAVIFDLGNVLCKLDRPACDTLIASHSPLPVERVSSLVWGGEIELGAETGRFDSREHFKRIRESIHADLGWTYEEFCQEYMHCLIPQNESEKAVIRAQELGLRVFILSNTSYLHSRFIFSREILATIPELYALSFKIGAMKPDRAMWDFLIERSNLKPEECIYFDDIPAYQEMGTKLGFKAALYNIETENLVSKLEALLK
ncbi:glucose-1-phosphatase [Treponema sp.]